MRSWRRRRHQKYPAFWIVGLIVLALLGDGVAAVGPVFTRT
jgi:hypothetical protein